MESIKDVINWLTELRDSKYIIPDDISEGIKVLTEQDIQRSAISKDEEKKIRSICTTSYVLLNKAVVEVERPFKHVPLAEKIHNHLGKMRIWGFHD